MLSASGRVPCAALALPAAPAIPQGSCAAPLAVVDKCCLCCPGTPELPRTCWLRRLLLCILIRLGSFNLLPCSSCSLSPSLLGCLSLLLAVCWVGWFFFPNCPHFYLRGNLHFIISCTHFRAFSCIYLSSLGFLASFCSSSTGLYPCSPASAHFLTLFCLLACVWSLDHLEALSRCPDLLPQTFPLFKSTHSSCSYS